jgi:hypothetical protein
MTDPAPTRTAPALVILLIVTLLAFAVSLFDYFWTGNGIHGSEGALLVVGSTFLMVVAAALFQFGIVRSWLRALFEILLALDVFGTLVAAYFLESWLLLGLVVLAAIALLVHAFTPRMVELRA